MRDRNDRDELIADLLRRVEELERATPLENSAIVDGPGIAVEANAGIHLEGLGSLLAAGFLISRDDGGSAVAAGAYLTAAGGGRIGAGQTYIRSSDGALVNADGELLFATNVRGVASGTFAGRVRGMQGVEGPINGQQRELGAAIAAADSKAGQASADALEALEDAAFAQETANQALEAATGESDGATLKNANLISPKITGITAGGQDSDWVPMLINKNTGALRAYGSAAG